MNLSGSRQKPRVIPGKGLRQTSSPTSPVPISEVPASSTTSIAIPSAGPPTEHALIGCAGVGEGKHAPTSVPPLQRLARGRQEEARPDLRPAGAVDDRDARAADVLEQPAVRLGVPRLA